MQLGKLEEAEDFKCVFVVNCVLESKIDQLDYCVNCYVIIYSLVLHARDLIFFTTDLQTVNYYTTIHC